MSSMEPGRNPPRYHREPRSYTGWIIGAVAALAVIAAIIYGMSDRSKTAGTAAPDTTTGQSSPAPGGPPAGAPATNR